MKKKWINLKRRWRKLKKADRTYFVGMGVLIAINAATLPWIPGNVINIVWLLLLIWMQWRYVVWSRKMTYRDLLRGSIHQWYFDNQRYNNLVDRLLEEKSEYTTLNSKYKKLEYDYHQLKKQVKKTRTK